MRIDMEDLTTEETIQLYPKILKELKKRGIIKTKNLIGEIGAYLAIKNYAKNPKLPNLKLVKTTTKKIDAVSSSGDRYSIKTVSGKVTGVFHGLEQPNSKKQDEPMFEYVLIVIFDNDYQLDSILEIDWKQFLEIKKWHSGMDGWNIPINSTLRNMAKNIL